jgi:hypothetical protein
MTVLIALLAAALAKNEGNSSKSVDDGRISEILRRNLCHPETHGLAAAQDLKRASKKDEYGWSSITYKLRKAVRAFSRD